MAPKERPRTPCGGQTLDFDSLKKVVDLVRAIVCKLDSKGNILWMNRYGLEFFGFREEELLGRSVYETIVPLRESTGRDLSGLFMKILKSDGEVAPSINENLRKDGSRVWVYWSNVVLTDGGEKTVLSTGIDITERVRFELDLKRIHERERALIRILSLLMSSTAGIEEVSAAVLEEAKRLTGSEYGFVGTIDPESKEFVGHTLKSLLSGESRAPYYPTGSAAEPTPGVTEPLFPEEARAPEPAPGCRLKGTFRFPPDPDGKYRSLFGHALNTGEAFFTNSPRSHPASNGTPPGHVQINRFLAVPVLGLPSRAVLGLIALANPRTDASGQQIKVGAQSERSEAMTGGSRPLRDYTEEDLKAVSFLAHYFSLAIQRKALEEKVSSSETYYRELFENSPIPILQIRIGDGIITKVNSAFELLFGYQKPEVEGKLIWKRLVHPSDLPRLEEYRKARLSGLEAPIKYEVKLLTKSGEVLECQANIVRRKKEDLLVAVADLTELKRTELELRRSKEELEMYSKHLEGLVQEKTKELLEKERLAAIGETALMVGHDLRNPLQAMINLSFLMKELSANACSCASPEKVAELNEIAQKIEKNVRYMDRIVSDLQDYGKPIVVERVPVSLKEVLDLALLGVETPKGIRLIIDFGFGLGQVRVADAGYGARAELSEAASSGGAGKGGSGEVKGGAHLDSGKLEAMLPPQLLARALKNLIINGIQAMPDGGALTVSAWLEQGGAEAPHVGTATTPYADPNRASETSQPKAGHTITAVFSVSDTGPGIRPDIREKLFKPFKTTKAKGTGLGLAIVKRIVDALGGTIEVESELGKGTKFIIRIPTALPLSLSPKTGIPMSASDKGLVLAPSHADASEAPSLLDERTKK